MNNQIRTLLIDQARKRMPITYGDVMKRLGLDHGNIDHRNNLSNELYAISKFEHSHRRPLLSSMAMYSGLADHGPGFYELAEDFGFGDKKSLTESLFAFQEMNKCQDFWLKDDNYQHHYRLSPTVSYDYPFFNGAETDFLHNWGGLVYDKENAEHWAAKNYIMNGAGSKTVFWSKALLKLLPGFETFNWRMWSQKGWEKTAQGNKQVARFKRYTWARIYKTGDGDRDIFFTVGLDGYYKELVYKLDYYFEANSNLSAAQKEIIQKNIPQELRKVAIPMSEFGNYDWTKLIELTRNFIAENTDTYDRLISLAWGKTQPEQVFNNALRKRETPLDGFGSLPSLSPSFTGTETDYIKEGIENKEVGDAGEELVKQYEKKFLIAAGRQDLASKVDFVKDGEGYDILSYSPEGVPKHIEVKTTSGGALNPFYYTLNEYLYAEKNPDSYTIYRLYNFDGETNTADFYILDKPLIKLLFQPVVYKAYIRKPEK